MLMHVCFMATMCTHRTGGLHEDWLCYGTLLYNVTRLSDNGLVLHIL